MSNKDKFGFYEVGLHKTYSKLEALELHGKTKLPINWNFNDNVFGSFNWAFEPKESLDFYYAKRVKQLRDQYDYLILMFSGGPDSSSILNAFVEYNVFIDEICQYHNLSAENDNKKAWLNEEVFYNSAPRTQQLIDTNPVYKNTLHRLIDITALQQDILKIHDYKFDIWYKTNGYHSPNNLARTHMREQPEYRKIIDSGKKVCFIWGVDKPNVSSDDQGNYWLTFTDARDGQGVTAATQILNREWEHDEYFFWSPDLPELPCKQGHVVKKFLESLTPQHIDKRYVFYGKSPMDQFGRHVSPHGHMGTRKDGENTYYLLMSGLNTIIYKDYNPDLVVCGKPVSVMFSPRDHWFFKDTTNEMNQSMFISGMWHLRKLVKQIDPNMWWEHKFNRNVADYSGGMQYMTKKYLLGKQNDSTRE